MSGGMITSDVSGKADTVLTTKGDIATWDTERVRKGVSATNYTGLQADSAIADGLTYGATSRSTMTGTADMIYSSSANTLSRLAVGSARQVLQTNSATNALEWSNSPQSLMGTIGDILSASGANTLSVISPSTSGDVLTSNGAGVLPTFQTAGGGGDANFIVSAFQIVDITAATLRCGGLWQNDFGTSNISDSSVSIPLEFDWELNRIEFKNTSNTMQGDAMFYFRDDGATIATVTIPDQSTGLFSAGALTVAVASGSNCNWKMDTLARTFGTLFPFIYMVAYGKST